MDVQEARKKWGFYSCGLTGYEVKVNDDCESVTWIYVGTQREQLAHTARIYYTMKGRAYFYARGCRIYLDECVRYPEDGVK